jgi:uncharacterized protein
MIERTLPSAIGWFEIPASDFMRAQRFYSEIFTAEFPIMRTEETDKVFAMFPVDVAKTPGGAIVHGPGYEAPSKMEGVKVYLNAGEDLNRILDRVEDAGGKIAVHKTQISPEFGYMGAFIDTEGNWIGLHSLK